MTAPVPLAYILGALLIQLAAGIGVSVWSTRITGGRQRTAVQARSCLASDARPLEQSFEQDDGLVHLGRRAAVDF